MQNNRRTLFVSGLKSSVDANDIRRHFIDSEKVTLKRYRTTPYLKYIIKTEDILYLN